MHLDLIASAWTQLKHVYLLTRDSAIDGMAFFHRILPYLRIVGSAAMGATVAVALGRKVKVLLANHGKGEKLLDQIRTFDLKNALFHTQHGTNLGYASAVAIGSTLDDIGGIALGTGPTFMAVADLFYSVNVAATLPEEGEPASTKSRDWVGVATKALAIAGCLALVAIFLSDRFGHTSIPYQLGLLATALAYLPTIKFSIETIRDNRKQAKEITASILRKAGETVSPHLRKFGKVATSTGSFVLDSVSQGTTALSHLGSFMAFPLTTWP